MTTIKTTPLKKVSLYVGRLVSIIIIVGLLVSAIWFAYTAYQSFFTPQKKPFRINLTDFDYATIQNQIDCKTASIYNYPVNLVLYRTRNDVINPYLHFNSKESFDFEMSFPSGHIEGVGYYEDGSSEAINLSNDKSLYWSGTSSDVNIDVIKGDLVMNQYFCATKLLVQPTSLVSFPDELEKEIKAIGVDKILGQNNSLHFQFFDLKVSDGSNTKEFESAEFNFTASTTNLSSFVIKVTGKDIMATLPEALGDFGSNPLEVMRVRATGIEIKQPVGILKYGNDAPIEMQEISSWSDDILYIASATVEDSLPKYRILAKSASNFDISGSTNSLLLNNEQLSKTRWRTLPEYVQAGLFGLVLSFIGGLWTLRNSIGKRFSSLLSFWGDTPSVFLGDFGCVTSSGTVIEGELSRRPTRGYPYYLIRNARRKQKYSDNWEKEFIKEIKIRAASVEQSYDL